MEEFIRRKRLHVKKLVKDAKIPERGTSEAAGYDFFAAEDIDIPPMTTVIVPTGIAMEVPVGYVLFLKEKSGIAVKTALFLKAGVVDSDYRGEIGFVYSNLSTEVTYKFAKGQKVGQGVFLGFVTFAVGFVEVDELSSTDRGAGGYGSTGDF